MKTVLIVDDVYSMRSLLKKVLKDGEYEVIGEAKNGAEGLKLYKQLQPDFVTMDIKLPDISGIEVTKQILEFDKDAIIIAISGNSDEKIKQEILDAGALSYQRKPFQPAYIYNKINQAEEIINKRQIAKEAQAQTQAENVETNIVDDKTIEVEEEIEVEKQNEVSGDNTTKSDIVSLEIPQDDNMEFVIEGNNDIDITPLDKVSDEIEVVSEVDLLEKNKKIEVNNETDYIKIPTNYDHELTEEKVLEEIKQEEIEKEKEENKVFEIIMPVASQVEASEFESVNLADMIANKDEININNKVNNVALELLEAKRKKSNEISRLNKELEDKVKGSSGSIYIRPPGSLVGSRDLDENNYENCLTKDLKEPTLHINKKGESSQKVSNEKTGFFKKIKNAILNK